MQFACESACIRATGIALIFAKIVKVLVICRRILQWADHCFKRSSSCTRRPSVPFSTMSSLFCLLHSSWRRDISALILSSLSVSSANSKNLEGGVTGEALQVPLQLNPTVVVGLGALTYCGLDFCNSSGCQGGAQKTGRHFWSFRICSSNPFSGIGDIFFFCSCKYSALEGMRDKCSGNPQKCLWHSVHPHTQTLTISVELTKRLSTISVCCARLCHSTT